MKAAASQLEPLRQRFKGELALIFASGPSLSQLWQAGRRPEWPSIAVNDAWRIVPDADVLYSTDNRWWRYHNLCPEFKGVKVGARDLTPCAEIINLEMSGDDGYDERLGWVRHGWNSGYAATHLAVQLGACSVALVGFDHRDVDGKAQFFGAHDSAMGIHWPNNYNLWLKPYAGLAKAAAKRGVEIMNATPNSAITCLPTVDLDWLCPKPSA